VNEKRLQRDFSKFVYDQIRTMILPVVMYGCETWSLILRRGKQAEGV
jgi:hypothetical protein